METEESALIVLHRIDGLHVSIRQVIATRLSALLDDCQDLSVFMSALCDVCFVEVNNVLSQLERDRLPDLNTVFPTSICKLMRQCLLRITRGAPLPPAVAGLILKIIESLGNHFLCGRHSNELPSNVRQYLSILYSLLGNLLTTVDTATVRSFSARLFEILLAICTHNNSAIQQDGLMTLAPVFFSVSSNVDTYFCNFLSRLLPLQCDVSDALMVICCSNELMFSEYSCDASLQHIYSWVLAGLTHEQQLSRKRARYVLRRVIDRLHSRAKSVHCELPPWQQEDMAFRKSSWDDLLTVLESLEEKQVHIIKPTLSLYGPILSSGSCIPLPFSLSVLSRGFCHDSAIIVRWAVLRALQFTELPDELAKFFLDHTLPALNNASLFSDVDSGFLLRCGDIPKTNRTPPTECGRHLMAFLLRFFSGRDIANRMNEFVKRLFSSSWTPVALVHMSQALGALSLDAAVVHDEFISAMCSFFCHQLSSMETAMRDAVVYYMSAFFLSHWRPSSSSLLSSLMKIVGVRPCRCAICAPNIEYRFSLEEFGAELLKQLLESAVNDTNGSCEQRRKLAHLCVLFEECGGMRQCSVKEGICSSLCHCNTELYRPCCDVVADIAALTEWLSCSGHAGDSVNCRIDVNPCIESALTYAAKMCLSSDDKSTEMITVCGQFVDCICGSNAPDVVLGYFITDDLLSRVSTLRPSRVICVVGVLGQIQPLTNISVKLLSSLRDLVSLALSLDRHSIEISGAEFCCDHSGELWSYFSNNMWSLLANICSVWSKRHPIDHLPVMAENILSSLDSCPRQCVVNIVAVAAVLCPTLSPHHFADICKAVWQVAFEHRKSETFVGILDGLARLLLNESTISRADLCDTIIMMLDRFIALSESSGVVLYQLLLALFSFLSVLRADLSFIPIELTDALSRVVSTCLLYGPVHRRHMRSHSRTLLYLSRVLNRGGHAFVIDSQIRALAVNTLLLLVDIVCMNGGAFIGQNISQDTVDSSAKSDPLRNGASAPSLSLASPGDAAHILLCCVFASAQKELLSGSVRRHFANSLTHRRQFRSAQTLLLMTPYMVQSFCEDTLCRSLQWLLEGTCLQPSVKCYIQWLCVIVCLRFSSLVTHIWRFLDQASRERTSVVPSFIVIIHQLCELPNVCNRRFIEQCYSTLLPCSMAQHFSSRLAALVTLRRVRQVCVKFEMSDVALQYEQIDSAVELALSRGHITEASVKPLHKDLLLTEIHPVSCFSLQTIYTELPRLAALDCDEWLSVSWLRFTAGCLTQSTPPLSTRNCDRDHELLVKLRPLNDRTDGGADLHQEHGVSDNVPSVIDLKISTLDGAPVGGAVVQRKVAPWRQLCDAPGGESGPDGAVLVASLIDRAPNLGGLCRTCEVFGVGTMTVNNASVLNDNQFSNLCVSADKWINITEVGRDSLCAYLCEMRRLGYQLVGVEQTSFSVMLHSCSLRRNCVIVLGHEREGIPVPVLQMLDVLLEIPQFGMIRSLNVHVAGALVLWEYRKQHSLLAPDQK